VSMQSEVGNHKRRTLNTRLSSSTSAGTFACPAGPYRNCRGEAGTKNDPNLYFVPSQKKDPKIDPHFSNLKSRESLFRRVSLMMMMIAFITFKSSLVPLFEGL